MNSASFANQSNHTNGVINFTDNVSHKSHLPEMHYCQILQTEVEELIADIRQFILHAQNNGDAFEYFRLCEELKLAEAAHADTAQIKLVG